MNKSTRIALCKCTTELLSWANFKSSIPLVPCALQGLALHLTDHDFMHKTHCSDVVMRSHKEEWLDSRWSLFNLNNNCTELPCSTI